MQHLRAVLDNERVAFDVEHTFATVGLLNSLLTRGDPKKVIREWLDIFEILLL